jgi:hypothetical protein
MPVLGLIAMCAASALMLSYGHIAGYSPVTMTGGIFVMSLLMLDVLCDVAGRHRSPTPPDMTSVDCRQTGAAGDDIRNSSREMVRT